MTHHPRSVMGALRRPLERAMEVKRARRSRGVNICKISPSSLLVSQSFSENIKLYSQDKYSCTVTDKTQNYLIEMAHIEPRHKEFFFVRGRSNEVSK
jgi:hypothetical protein